jgi:hypothetical protein
MNEKPETARIVGHAIHKEIHNRAQLRSAAGISMGETGPKNR